MLLKHLLISIAICLLVTNVVWAQEAPTADPATEKPLSEEEQKQAQEREKEALEKAEEQRKQENARKAKPPKEVFKPTEEISEDSPVPFPIDI